MNEDGMGVWSLGGWGGKVWMVGYKGMDGLFFVCLVFCLLI